MSEEGLQANSVSPKVFLLGLLWAAGNAIVPTGGIMAYFTRHYEEGVDWDAIIWTAGPAAAWGAVLYWRKHKALLKLPPWIRQAQELAAQVKTTVKTVEQDDKPTKVITTVEETVIKEIPTQEPPK